MTQRPISVNATGLGRHVAYIAHENGNWGPEQKTGNWEQNKMKLSEDGSRLIYDASLLEYNEEFKIVVPVKDEEEAKKIFAERTAAGVHVNTRFDFDASHNTFWLLADSHPVVRPGEWNQNNVNL